MRDHPRPTLPHALLPVSEVGRGVPQADGHAHRGQLSHGQPRVRQLFGSQGDDPHVGERAVHLLDSLQGVGGLTEIPKNEWVMSREPE